MNQCAKFRVLHIQSDRKWSNKHTPKDNTSVYIIIKVYSLIFLGHTIITATHSLKPTSKPNGALMMQFCPVIAEHQIVVCLLICLQLPWGDNLMFLLLRLVSCLPWYSGCPITFPSIAHTSRFVSTGEYNRLHTYMASQSVKLIGNKSCLDCLVLATNSVPQWFKFYVHCLVKKNMFASDIILHVPLPKKISTLKLVNMFKSSQNILKIFNAHLVTMLFSELWISHMFDYITQNNAYKALVATLPKHGIKL